MVEPDGYASGGEKYRYAVANHQGPRMIHLEPPAAM
jgi:hypothetical protein